MKPTLIRLCTFIASREISLFLAKLADSFVVTVWDIESCLAASLLTTTKQFGSFFKPGNEGCSSKYYIKSLTSNFDMLQKSFASQGKIDLITLSETHISSAETGCEELYALGGYICFSHTKSCSWKRLVELVCMSRRYFIQTAI